MDDLKSKKARRCKKINDLLIKLRKKVRKRSRKKQKQKENLKTSMGASVFSQILKPKVEKNFGKLRIKTNRGIDGLFFKGLRSEFINRKAPDEANEAGKNEDINKIIDIGKIFLRREEYLGRPAKRLHDDETNDKELEKSVNTSSDGIEGSECCSLSPISSVIYSCNDKTKLTAKQSKRKKIDFEKEFENFSQKYEETVGTHVLCRLPKNGVLEDALNALRKSRKGEQTDPKRVTNELIEDETQFSKEFKFSAQGFELENPTAEDFIKNFIFSEELQSKTSYNYENFTEKSFASSSLDEFPNYELENYHDLSFQSTPGNYYETKNLYAFAFQEKNFENSAKNLSITSPPIQFYRRNMF